MQKKANNGYMPIPTFNEIKAAIDLIPDCNEVDIAGLMELGLINQAEYEELMTVVHGKNDDFKSAPYNNFGYYRQQGPLMPSQTVASHKSRLKKVADNASYQVSVQSEDKTLYYLDLSDSNGGFVSIFDIQNISPMQINASLCSQFQGVNDGTRVYFINQQDANDASNWLSQQLAQAQPQQDPNTDPNADPNAQQNSNGQV